MLSIIMVCMIVGLGNRILQEDVEHIQGEFQDEANDECIVIRVIPRPPRFCALWEANPRSRGIHPQIVVEYLVTMN
jgi:hypothetical protein